MQETYLDISWKERPDQIRKYYELHPLYEIFCSEVVSNLKHFLKAENIEYAQVSYRVKTLESFCEKMYRKSYENPILDITDLAGVRVVFLYESDVELIERIIRDNFEVIERVDKASHQGEEVFGYRALHYIIKIKKEASENRFSDLRDLVCEIQIRTALQDAWSLVAHHLSYKQESDVPKKLRRKLNALSGLFETADNQLDSIRDARQKYQAQFESDALKSDNDFLKAEINLDNLNAYMHWKFPNRVETLKSASELLNEIHQLGYHTLIQLDKVVDRTFDAVVAYEKVHPPFDGIKGMDTIYNGIGVIRNGLAMIHNDYYKQKHSEKLAKNKLPFVHLVKP